MWKELARFFAAKRKRDARPVRFHHTDASLPAHMLWCPDVLKLQPEDYQLLQWLRRELRNELGRDTTVQDLDVLYFALQEVALAMSSPAREDTTLKLLVNLSERQERAKTRSKD